MQAWIYNDGQPKWIMLDFGIMSEAINSNQGGQLRQKRFAKQEMISGYMTFIFKF